MKKLASIILVFVLMLSILVTPAFAYREEYKDYYDEIYGGDEDWLFLDEFIENELIPRKNTMVTLGYYYEYCCHKDATGNIDWAFAEAYTFPVPGMELSHYVVINDKVIYIHTDYCIFYSGMVIYDVKKDKFFDLLSVDLSEYEGLEEYIDKNIGRQVGDADGDKELTVLDATFIQRAMAKLCEFNSNDYLEKYGYISDVDRDGERTVMDATKIQRHIAGLE